MRNKSEAKTESETEPERPTLKCPNCDNSTLSDFEWCEDVVSYRSVREFNEEGTLIISGMSDISDDGDNERFICTMCSEAFPIPDSISIEWE